MKKVKFKAVKLIIGYLNHIMNNILRGHELPVMTIIKTANKTCVKIFSGKELKQAQLNRYDLKSFRISRLNNYTALMRSVKLV